MSLSVHMQSMTLEAIMCMSWRLKGDSLLPLGATEDNWIIFNKAALNEALVIQH